MGNEGLTLARDLTAAYRSAVELLSNLIAARQSILVHDAIELRDLLFAEMLDLYLQTSNPTVRLYFHEVGIGERLLDESRIILRGEGERRRASLKALATNGEQLVKGPEVRLFDTVGRAVS